MDERIRNALTEDIIRRLFSVFVRRQAYNAAQLHEFDTRWKQLGRDESVLWQIIHETMPQNIPLATPFDI